MQNKPSAKWPYGGPMPDRAADYVDMMQEDLAAHKRYNKKSIEKLAAVFDIVDKTFVKELTELAIVRQARALAKAPGSLKERFDNIVALYESQVTLSHRTSQSILLQQYSTPAPIAFLAGVYCGMHQTKPGATYFEPSAGNGLLTIAADPGQFVVNEIDPVRHANLLTQPFKTVCQQDATQPFTGMIKSFQAIITNPPFGTLDKPVYYDGFPIRTLEQLMALRALDTMKDGGKAAIIIGGHTRWDDKGRIQAGRNRIFFNYLYSRYHVEDILNIDGHSLYTRQGTSFDVRLILINGRKAIPQGNAPIKAKTDLVIEQFDQLFERVVIFLPKKAPMKNIMALRNKALLLEQQLLTMEGLGAFDNSKYQDYLDDEGFVDFTLMYEYYTELKKEHPSEIILFETPDTYSTFEGDAEILAETCHIGLVTVTGEPYEKLTGISKITREPQLKALTKAGYNVLIIENNKGTDIEQLKADMRNWALRFGKAHSAQDRKEYEQYRSMKNWDTKNVVLFHHPETNQYTCWGWDGDVMRSIFKLPIDRSIVIENGAVVGGFSFPASKIKDFTTRLRKKGYEAIIIDKTLGAPYVPGSQACIVLNTQTPDSMAFETRSAIEFIKQAVGGDMDNFVRHRLKYPSKAALCRVLSAEQIDAVAMAIYNIEARNQGMIIGDQTGIGKGRVAAAMIRYGVMQGLKPVFLTEKANLFSDIYRDLFAIGSGHFRPFIVNGREAKTDIKDEDGNIIYQAPPLPEQQAIFEAESIAAQYHFTLGTYSQFNSIDKKPTKPLFLLRLAPDNIFILDEAHNASGSSNTGEFLQKAVSLTKGVVFLSATFAKRPDNMPIYAMKTAMSDCNMTREELVEAVNAGGVALQEVLSAQLVAEGQMIRRERSFEGIEVNYIPLDQNAPEHKAIADNITGIIRSIIAFQKEYIDDQIEQLDEIAVAEGKEVTLREGTSQAGVDNTPYFSKVFQVINQMLFSLKAEAVADRTIQRLKEGKKPVIAFSSTMGSFIENILNEQGLTVGDGDMINADFSEVLRRGLQGVLRYTERDITGKPIYKYFDLADLPVEAQIEYQRILEQITEVSTGISLSPIDVIIKRIQRAGFTVAEVTGRKYELQLNANNSKALVLARKRINTNDAFRQFNNNEVDVLMINQSGSTGASAHAIPTALVPASQVRQRVMIVLQAELDISTEVQKRGRINRTGQILQPIYDYLISAIPAEKRLMMMLQKKLKSLDANTTSNQKQSTKILDVPDFLNKYGDKLVNDYLEENPTINKLLNDPLGIGSGSGLNGDSPLDGAASKVSGRVAVLSTKMQEDFYNEIVERYNDYIEFLQQVGEYDLEVESLNLDAETLSTRILTMGKGGDSAFGTDSYLEKVRVNVLKKPFTAKELGNLLVEALQGKEASDLQQALLDAYQEALQQRLEEDIFQVNEKYDALISAIPNEKKLLRLQEKEGMAAFEKAMAEREKEFNAARQTMLQNLEKTSGNRRFYIERMLKFFHIGRFLKFPITNYQSGEELIPCVFLGFLIDMKKKNPFAPSAMKLRFAIASGTKFMALPATYSETINAIMGASIDLPQLDFDDMLGQWETFIKENNTDRRIRYIISGNLLQAFAKSNGKLISYTTIDGQIKKGILLPENWEEKAGQQKTMSIPIIKALPLIRSLVVGKPMVTNNDVTFMRTPNHFKIITSAARSKAGDVYLDKEILELVEKHNFEKVSDKMVALLPEEHIVQLVEILQKNHSASITIPVSDSKYLHNNTLVHSDRHPIELPPLEEEPTAQQKKMKILKLKAKALLLELELLKAA